MRNPRVLYLRYEIVAVDNDVEFGENDDLRFATDDFTVELSRSPRLPGLVGLTSVRLAGEPDPLPTRRAPEVGVVFTTLYTTEEAARERVEPWLSAWAVDAGLRGCRIAFELIGGCLEDMDEPPESPSRYSVWAGGRFHVVDPSLRPRPVEYPAAPPQGFAVDKRVQTLWDRWQKYLSGAEPLLSAAYYCLTLVEQEFDPGGRGGKRDRVARSLALDPAILAKLGELTAKGESTVARKHNPAALALSAEERAWVEAVVRVIIRRVAEIAASRGCPSPERIRMTDLPSLARGAPAS